MDGRENLRVHTVPRSGTYFLKNLMATYLGAIPSFEINHYYVQIDIGIKVKNEHQIYPFETIPLEHILKVVFIYRNPLDQAVSLYDHSYAKGKKFKFHKVHAKYYGDCKSPFDLAMNSIPTYTTLYVSNMRFGEKFPQKTLSYSYEYAQKEPFKCAGSMMEHLFGTLDADKLRKALNSCSIPKMKTKESQDHRTLGGDLKFTPGTSHMDDGRVGKWKDRFTFDEVEKVKKAYLPYGIDISQFDGIREFLEI